MAGPLDGIQVLDLTRALAGPYCTQLLGDMGAEIIKLEMPQGGDESRRWGPFWNELSCYYLATNRNKRSLVVDLKTDAGRKIALALAKQSDVCIENSRPGVMSRLGLDYDTLVAFNRRLVYCSISGFGQEGPRAQEPAFDLMMQGFTGLMGLTGHPGEPPVRVGLPVIDFGAGLLAAFGITAALLQREQDGLGQKVETSLLEGQLSWLSYCVLGFFANGTVPRGMGGAHHSITPYQICRAKDDYFVLAVGNDVQWRRLCHAIRRPELAEDFRFATNRERLEHREVLDAILDEVFSRFTAAELIVGISQAGVPCGPINGVDDIVADPQVLHIGLIKEVPHRSIPDLRLTGVPITLSRTPGEIHDPPPLLGEHTDQILHELGYSDKQIQRLRSEGVVA
jgi:formyl-CoA transferase/CoA:oxalate CoA-transferase